MKSRYLFICIVCCLLSSVVRGQTDEQIDSLLSLLATAKEDTNKVNILIQLASMHESIGSSKAMLYALDARGLAENLHYSTGHDKVASIIGNIYLKEGRFQMALSHYSQMLRESENSGNKQTTIAVLNDMGNVFYKIGNYPKQLECYLKALKISEEIGDKKLIALSLNNVGNLNYNQRKLDQAMSYYKRSLKIRQEINDLVGIAGSYNNMANIFSDWGNDSIALDYYAKALKTNTETGNKNWAATNCGNMGLIYNAQGKYQLALENFSKSLKLRLEIGDQTGTAGSYCDMGNVYTNLNRFDEAMEYFHKGLELSKRIDGIEWIIKSYEGLSYAHEKMGNHARSLEYHKLKSQYKDTLYDIASSEKIAEMQARYEASHKDQLIENLKHQSLIRELEVTRQKLIKWILAAGIILLVLFFVFLYKRYRINTKTNRALQISLEEKNVLLKEIHHRVKNNLQIISSLLNLQGNNIEDTVAINVLRESQSRINSMALIHRKLYETTNIRSADIQEYFEHLLSSIAETFNTSKRNIECKVTCNQINFDLDTIISLGLIVNELATNAYKYAFTNRKSGVIQLELLQHDKKHQLIFHDNGIGLPEGLDIEHLKTLGLSLVFTLTNQLEGTIEYYNDNGATFVIHF